LNGVEDALMRQKWCCLLAMAVVMACGAGQARANEKANSSPAASMNIAEAHSFLRKMFPRMYWFSLDGKGDDLARGDVSISQFTLVTKKDNQTHQCLLKNLGGIKTGRAWGSPTVDFVCGPNVTWRLYFRGFDDPTVQQVVEALSVLKAVSAIVPPAEDPAFLEVVRDYQSSAAKPALSEEARAFKVQAEAAVNEKKFEYAVDLYGHALQLAPWWPEGHFNRAILLGEVDAFGLAEIEMQRYLALVPDAPDARAAQDKIYVWQSKSKESQVGVPAASIARKK
jgi:hypothetical protein